MKGMSMDVKATGKWLCECGGRRDEHHEWKGAHPDKDCFRFRPLSESQEYALLLEDTMHRLLTQAFGFTEEGWRYNRLDEKKGCYRILKLDEPAEQHEDAIERAWRVLGVDTAALRA